MPTIDITTDVTDVVGLPGRHHTVATVHLPDPSSVGSAPIVCFGFPGGGYNRTYWSMDVPARTPGGQAAWHTARGWIFVTCDHLQVGESTAIDPDVHTFETIAAGNAATVRNVLARLATGLDSLAPIADPVALALGQSMGGTFTIATQAHHRVFDGVGILGSGAVYTEVPTKPGAPTMVMPWISRSGFPGSFTMLRDGALPDMGAVSADEHPFTWAFHHEAQEPGLAAQDMAGMAGGPLASWRSATVPACASLMITPGMIASEAAAITVPVFVGVGERDVVPDVWGEPRAYRSSTDVTVYICPQMAHMHNFAPTRERLWQRLHSWGTSVAEQVALTRG